MFDDLLINAIMVSLNKWLISEQVKHENLYNKITYRWYCFRINVPRDGKGVLVFLLKNYLPVISNLSMKTYKHESYVKSLQVWDCYFLSMSSL